MSLKWGKFLTAVLLAYCLLLVSFFTACPKDSAVRKATRASYELSGLTRDVIAATDKAYTQHDINLQTKNVIADKLIIIAAGGKRFNEIASSVNNINTDTVVVDKLALLNQILSEQIAGPFLQIIEVLKVLPPGATNAFRVALAALRTAILTISGVISKTTENQIIREDAALWAIA